MYSQSLEAELKKLQATNKDSTERFDENLRKLAQKKLKCQMAIFQVRYRGACLFIGARLDFSSGSLAVEGVGISV